MAKHYSLQLKEELEKQEIIDMSPKTFSKKIENYWFHYKAHTIGALVVLLVAAFAIYEYATKVHPDISITFSASVTLAADAQLAFDEMLSAHADDFNGDQRQIVQVVPLPLPKEDDPTFDVNVLMASQVRLAAEFSSYENLLMILNDEVLFYLMQDEDISGIFVDFAALYPGLELDSPNKLPLSKTSLDFSAPYFARIDLDETFIVMRSVDKLEGKKLEQAQKVYDYQLEFIDKIVLK